MNVRRRFLPFAVLGLSLATAVPASAHRLDEYLQATRLSIDLDRVSLEMDLTAGVAVAPEVFAWIDTDRDGHISHVEGQAYARQLLRSIELSVDDRPVLITLDEIQFPQWRELALGTGTIRARATAGFAAAGAGRHHVSYVNTHRPETSVYLVNTLVPADPRIQIGGQRRDRTQHAVTVDYTVADASWARTWSLVAALAMAVVLGATRRPRTNPPSS